MDFSEQTGLASTLSVALTETETGTILPFGGQVTEGVADTSEMTGAVVSGSTSTTVVAVLAFPDASVQVTVSE